VLLHPDSAFRAAPMQAATLKFGETFVKPVATRPTPSRNRGATWLRGFCGAALDRTCSVMFGPGDTSRMHALDCNALL